MAAPARGEEPVAAACEGELATLAAALAGPGAPVSEAERAILPQGPHAAARPSCATCAAPVISTSPTASIRARPCPAPCSTR